MKKVISNFSYQSIFQVIKIIMPIITVPIVSSALGPEGLGTFRFTNSIVQYFVLISSLGTLLYGQRQISVNRNNIADMSKQFWNIEAMSLTISFCLSIFYLLFCSIFARNWISVIQVFFILSVAFDISWFFMGTEDFKSVSIRNVVISLIQFFIIVLFVKNNNDLVIYVLVQSVGTFLGSISMWPLIWNKVIRSPITFRDMVVHFKGAFGFFIPQLSISFFTILNTTMLGIYTNDRNVAFYTSGLQLTQIALAIIGNIDTVLLPNLSNLVTKKNHQKVMSILQKSINVELFLAIPVYFGIVGTAEKMIPWFFSLEFQFVIYLLPFLATLVIIKTLGLSISRQYLIPYGKMSNYRFPLYVAAIIGVIGNLILVPPFGIWGSVATILLAEVFVAYHRIRTLKKETNFTYNTLFIGKITFAACLMCGIIYFFFKGYSPTILTTLIQILTGSLVYMLVTGILKANPIVDLFLKRKEDIPK